MDDLVRQLRRDAAEFDSETYTEAADRIEALVADLKKEKDKVDRLLQSHLFTEKMLYAVLAKEKKDD